MTIKELSIPQGIPTETSDFNQAEHLAALLLSLSQRVRVLVPQEISLVRTYLDNRSHRYSLTVREDGTGLFRAVAIKPDAMILHEETNDRGLKLGGEEITIDEENPIFVLGNQDENGNFVIRDIWGWEPGTP